MVAVMGVASITPALPDVAKDLRLSEQQVAWLISGFTLPGIILTPLAGMLADRIGRKKVIIPALFLFAGSGFALFFVHDYALMLGIRLVQGIGAAPLGSLNATLIGDYFKGKQLPVAMGYNSSVLSLSTAIYPLLGGILAGIAWYYPFLLPLLAIPVGFAALFALKEPAIDKPVNFKDYFREIAKTILHKEILTLFGLATITFIILYGALLTYVPFLLNQRFDLSSSQIGLVISLSSITTAILSSQIGRLTWKFGSKSLITSAFILYFLVMLALPNTSTLTLLLIPIVLFGAAQALNLPSLHTLLANLAPDNQRAIFMSLNGTAIRVGQTLGPLIIGIAYSLGGLKWAYYLGALFAVLGMIIAMLWLKREEGSEDR